MTEAASVHRPRLRAAAEAVHALAAATWLTAATWGAVTASSAFATLPDLQPTLATFAGFEGDHARLAAGKVAAPVFLIADIVQFAAATLATASLLVLLAFGCVRVARISTFGRLLGLGAGLIALGFQVIMLGPEMQAQLKGYWAEAQLGNTDSAMAWQAAFMHNHDTARTVTVAILIGVVAMIACGGWSAATGPSEPADTADTGGTGPRTAASRSSRYETPKLATRPPGM